MLLGHRPDPVHRSTATYDPLDRRDTTRRQGKTFDHAYVGLTERLSREQHVDGAGNVTQSSTYDYDSGLRRLGQTTATAGGTTSYRSYALDANGSVEGLEGDTGALAPNDTYNYDPYGELDTQTGMSDAASAAPFRFQGFYSDSAVKTYDMQARSYRPDIGRFLSQDRFEAASADVALQSDPLTQNRYAFAGGNPVNHVEFDGHYAESGDTRTNADGRTYDKRTGERLDNKRDYRRRVAAGVAAGAREARARDASNARHDLRLARKAANAVGVEGPDRTELIDALKDAPEESQRILGLSATEMDRMIDQSAGEVRREQAGTGGFLDRMGGALCGSWSICFFGNPDSSSYQASKEGAESVGYVAIAFGMTGVVRAGAKNALKRGAAAKAGFTAPKVTRTASGEVTNGTYTVSRIPQARHTTGSTTSGKSQFLFRVDADQAVLDAAAYADEAGLWVGNKAKVLVNNGPVGVHGGSGQLTNYVNVYRTKGGYVHGAPGRPPR